MTPRESMVLSPSPVSSAKKHRRKSHPKTKNGCRTCRTRRVKCGEERPECARCKKFGVRCDWASVQSKETKEVRLSTRPATRSVQILPKTPSIAPRPPSTSKDKRAILLRKSNLMALLLPDVSKELFDNNEERLYFEIFTSRTSFDILPRLDSGTLRQILLLVFGLLLISNLLQTEVATDTFVEACVSDASIRHAVVALGALEKTAESLEVFGSTPIEGGRHEASLHHHNALKQYTTAIRYMREAASSSKDIRTALLACLMIFCFEAWDGLKQNAVQQVQTGLRLIRIWREQQFDTHRVEDWPSQSRTGIEDDLIRAFSRLDVQAISFAPEEGYDEQNALAWTQEGAMLNRMPQVFSSIQEAEIYENVIMRRAMRFLSSKVPLPKPPRPSLMFPVNGWYGVTSPPVVALQQSILSHISRWTAAFDPLWRRLKSQNESSLLVANMLCGYLKTGSIALIQVCMGDEDDWDDYQPLFVELVELAEYIANALNVLTSSASKFQFDTGIVIPLMMIGHKCREPKLRRRAIHLLLDKPCREGVWDSVAAGACAAWYGVQYLSSQAVSGASVFRICLGALLLPSSQFDLRVY